MKMNNKKLLAIIMVLIMILSFGGCGKKSEDGLDSYKEKKATVEEKSDDEENYKQYVMDWHNKVIDACIFMDTTEVDRLTGNENASNLISIYSEYNLKKEDKYSINILDIDGDIILFTLKHSSTGFFWIGGLVKVNGEYVFWDKNFDSMSQYMCTDCAGKGYYTVQNANQLACAICGGTGQQYNPSLYYDAVMGWQGGYTACSGCAGSGYTGGVAPETHTCTNCDGIGYTD